VTELEWLTCADPMPMLKHLQPAVFSRKSLLHYCACADRLGDSSHLGERWLRVRQLAEGVAEGQANADALTDAAADLFYQLEYGADGKTRTLFLPHLCCAWLPGSEHMIPGPEDYAAYDGEFATQANLVREIWGNPFRPVNIEPGWLAWKDATVAELAQAVYVQHAFDRLPVLADALEEAGCNNVALLKHCRAKGSHSRGCWAVDLLLGKK
jgi:hypothetical protein